MASKPLTKSQVVAGIAEQTELSRKQVSAVFQALADLIGQSLGKKGAGLFTVPGLMKIKVKNVPARKAGKRIDPFTKQERMFPAKPASKRVKVLPLKALKDMAK